MVAARGARRTGPTGDPCGGGAGHVMANSEGQMRSDSRMGYVSETIARCRPWRRKEVRYVRDQLWERVLTRIGGDVVGYEVDISGRRADEETRV